MRAEGHGFGFDIYTQLTQYEVILQCLEELCQSILREAVLGEVKSLQGVIFSQRPCQFNETAFFHLWKA